MRIHDDLSRPVIVHAGRLEWTPSPAAGVDRRMLFRIGGEVARATSIVRYAPGSAFPRHTHGGGEEILVLDGVFQDEHGDYPAGSYVRNPPGTSHVPASREGCILFVRLWQFRDGDDAQVVRRPGEGRDVTPRPGAAAATVLFDDGHEEVRVEDWAAGGRVTVENGRGLEFLIREGRLRIGDERLEPQSWGRLPAGTHFGADIGPSGARIWMRHGPLLHPDACRYRDLEPSGAVPFEGSGQRKSLPRSRPVSVVARDEGERRRNERRGCPVYDRTVRSAARSDPSTDWPQAAARLQPAATDKGDEAMSRKRILTTAIALASIAAASGLGTVAAQTSGTGGDQTRAPSTSASGTGDTSSDRPAGDFGPGGVPTQHETTTRASPPPSTTGPSNQKPPGDFGPGGVPTQHETTTQPSHRNPAEGGGGTGPDQSHSSQGH